MSFFELGWKWLSFLAFGFSIIAAVLAIDMYKLSRTGQFGASWRVLITATVIYALLQAARLAEDVKPIFGVIAHIVELVFVLALAYAFHLQRQLFRHASQFRKDDERASYHGVERRQRNEFYKGTERRRTHAPPSTLQDVGERSATTSENAKENDESPLGQHEQQEEREEQNDDIEWHTPRAAIR